MSIRSTEKLIEALEAAHEDFGRLTERHYDSLNSIDLGELYDIRERIKSRLELQEAILEKLQTEEAA